MLEQRDWCDDLEILLAYGTQPGIHFRCRRCRRVIRSYGIGSLKIGPCVADRWPCTQPE